MTELKKGDRVNLKGYGSLVEVDGVDDFLTEMLKKTHYTGTDVDFIEGRSKTTNCEPFTIDEIDTE